jgi:acyl-CoA thioesterase
VSEAVADPQKVARRTAETMWSRDAASRALGVELDEVAPGFARARLRVGESMLNGHGICHGGLVFLLADTAFAFACNSHGPETVAAGCDIVFVSPARLGDELVAEASERTRFGRNGVYDVTVRRADGSVVAEFRGQSRTTAERA